MSRLLYVATNWSVTTSVALPLFSAALSYRLLLTLGMGFAQRLQRAPHVAATIATTVGADILRNSAALTLMSGPSLRYGAETGVVDLKTLRSLIFVG